MNDSGEYELSSEEEVVDEYDEEADQNEDHTDFEFEHGAALVVPQNFSVEMRENEIGQRHNIFQSRAKVIIDGGSYHNLASCEMVDKLGLKLLHHPRPYHVNG